MAAIALLVGMMLVSASSATEAALREPILLDAAATGSGDAGQSGPAATSGPQTTTNRAANTINWMGHWYKADKRYDLVLEMKRDFAFRHQDITVNLQFPEQILGTNDKVAVAHLIVKMIEQKKYDWDIVWMDNHIYQFSAIRSPTTCGHRCGMSTAMSICWSRVAATSWTSRGGTMSRPLPLLPARWGC